MCVVLYRINRSVSRYIRDSLDVTCCSVPLASVSLFSILITVVYCKRVNAELKEKERKIYAILLLATIVTNIRSSSTLLILRIFRVSKLIATMPA